MPIYNIHAHTWNPEQHIAPATRAEADRARGAPMDLAVNFDRFMAQEAADCDKTILFGLKARRNG